MRIWNTSVKVSIWQKSMESTHDNNNNNNPTLVLLCKIYNTDDKKTSLSPKVKGIRTQNRETLL